MANCYNCKHAKWDYEDSVGSSCGTGYFRREWFVTGCNYDLDDPEGGECEKFEEDGDDEV